MDPLDSSKISFMLNHDNYYYNVIPFILKNTGATCQWLMDIVFVYQIWRNLDVYIDDMIVKTIEWFIHAEDL